MNRLEFFERVPAMRQNDRQRVQWAYALGKKWHDGQVRDSGVRYFEHVRGVANILIDYGYADAEYLIRAILHDVTEDTTISVSMLEQLFGPETTRGILVLSKSYGIEDPRTGFVIRSPTRTLTEYFAGIKRAGKREVVVKCADRIYNLSDLVDDPPAGSRWTPAKRLKQAGETRKWIIPLAEEHEPRFAEKLIHQCTLIELKAKQLLVRG
jgi:(p)ppGpp synthase/HD superfamily hydrolase